MPRFAGEFNQRAVITRREETLRPAGNVLGGYLTIGTIWVAARFDPPVERAEGGAAVNPAETIVTVRDSAFARGLTVDDRMRIAGIDYAVAGIAPPDVRSRTISLRVVERRG